MSGMPQVNNLLLNGGWRCVEFVLVGGGGMDGEGERGVPGGGDACGVCGAG